MNKKHIKSYIIIVTSIIFISFTLGCTSDTEYKPPSEVETISDTQEKTTSNNEEKPTEKQTEETTVHTFNIGDTATDGELKITVNDVRFTTEIDEKDNEYSVAVASSGNQFVIIDITVENILSDMTQTINPSFETEVIDFDGYTYDQDFDGECALNKALSSGDILPGMKKRGELVYKVPIATEDLKFVYKFDLFGGTSALFDIK